MNGEAVRLAQAMFSQFRDLSAVIDRRAEAGRHPLRLADFFLAGRPPLG